MESLKSVILDKFKNLTFVRSEDKNIITKEGWEIGYSIDIAKTIFDIRAMPTQIVIRVRKDGQHVITWGCVNQEEHSEFVEWFIEKSTLAMQFEFEKDNELKYENREKFRNL